LSELTHPDAGGSDVPATVSAERADPDETILRARIQAARAEAKHTGDLLVLHDLGAMLQSLYEFYGDTSALLEAVRVLRDAVGVGASDGIRDRLLAALGVTLTSCYELTSDVATLDEGIAHLSITLAKPRLR
jgi:hypothetical protein